MLELQRGMSASELPSQKSTKSLKHNALLVGGF